MFKTWKKNTLIPTLFWSTSHPMNFIGLQLVLLHLFLWYFLMYHFFYLQYLLQLTYYLYARFSQRLEEEAKASGSGTHKKISTNSCSFQGPQEKVEKVLK